MFLPLSWLSVEGVLGKHNMFDSNPHELLFFACHHAPALLVFWRGDIWLLFHCVRAAQCKHKLPVVTAVAVPTNLIPSAADGGQHLSLQLSVFPSEPAHISRLTPLHHTSMWRLNLFKVYVSNPLTQKSLNLTTVSTPEHLMWVWTTPIVIIVIARCTFSTCQSQLQKGGLLPSYLPSFLREQ